MDVAERFAELRADPSQRRRVHLVALADIQPWEPDKNKSRQSINYSRDRLLAGEADRLEPVVIEANTGRMRLKSGPILDTGHRRYLLKDGHHRYLGHEEAGVTHILAYINRGHSMRQLQPGQPGLAVISAARRLKAGREHAAADNPVHPHALGDQVRVRWTDGRLYPARVAKLRAQHIIVNWEDGSGQYRAPHQHVHKQLSPYHEWLRRGQGKQRGYIKNEQRKMRHLERLRRAHNPDDHDWASAPPKYKQAAHAIGLHPLTHGEITGRQRELAVMERDIPKTHGDSPAQRAVYHAVTGKRHNARE